jgi:hypothetical protein
VVSPDAAATFRFTGFGLEVDSDMGRHLGKKLSSNSVTEYR